MTKILRILSFIAISLGITSLALGQDTLNQLKSKDTQGNGGYMSKQPPETANANNASTSGSSAKASGTAVPGSTVNAGNTANTGVTANPNTSAGNKGNINTKSTAQSRATHDDKVKAMATTSDEFNSYEAAQVFIDHSKYTLGPDDIVDIVVMRHPEVSGQYTINKEGKVQYEFIGDVMLAGLTKEKAVDLLKQKLSVYIINPEVNFKITGYNSKIVYVVGEVAQPGRVPMHGDTITVRDALLAAGLPLLTAATQRSSLFTPSASGQVNIKKVNVEALLYQGDLRENFVMKPGDCLYVPATFLAKTMRAISPVTEPVAAVGGAGGAAKYAF